MQGYSTIVSEVFLQMTDMKDTLQADSQGNAFSHIFLQAGVGSFAGGIVGALVNYTKSGSSIQSKLPKIVVVEPKGAHCFFYSHNIGDGNLHGNFWC
jgi:diaminopropionate ammonia-lyase